MLGFLGIWGWGILAGLFILMVLFVYHEYAGKSFITFGAMLGFIYLFLGWNALGWVAAHWMQSITYFLGYFMFGALWSVFKWNRLNSRRSEKVRDLRKKFLMDAIAAITGRGDWVKSLGLSADLRDADKPRLLEALSGGNIPDEMLESWNKACDMGFSANRTFRYVNLQPSPFKYKARLLTWITFWWISAFNYFCYDMIVDIAKKIWKRLVNVYLAITKRHYADIDPRLLRKEED